MARAAPTAVAHAAPTAMARAAPAAVARAGSNSWHSFRGSSGLRSV
nr:hypothetical protein [Bacillus licheniformis]